MAITEREQQLQDAVYANALTAAQNGTRPTYAGTFEGQLNDIYDRIANREKFSYNVNEDPLYQSYKDQYIAGGKLAMKDTIGQAAALTGGYGNTYGQQVGQQAYNAYLQDLSKVIPQLYGMAYDQYQDEGDDLKDQYSMIGQMRDTEYGRYRDDLGDWEYDQRVAAEQEREDYNRRKAEDDTAYARQMEADKLAYQRQQQAYANLVAMIKASGAIPTDQQLADAGMTRADAEALRNEFLRQVAAEQAAAALQQREVEARIANYGASSGGSGGGGGSSGGSSRSSGGGGGGGGSYGGGGGSWATWNATTGESSSSDDYLDYRNAYDVAMAAVSSGKNIYDINAGLNNVSGLSSAEKRNVQEAYQAITQAGVNRAAYGSPTATKAQNMGGSARNSTTTKTRKAIGGR